MNEMTMACSMCGGEVRWILSFDGETTRKVPLGRPRHGWEDNIKMDEELDGGEWTGLMGLRIETGGGLL
jgi:hypothetical protein